MKQRPVIVALALGLALTLAGCSADSPSAPKPSPTPAALSIALDSSASSAEVGSAVTFQARVTQGGANAPDNTSVTFSLYSCPGPGVTSDPSFENGFCEVIRTTQSGVATATLVGRTAGLYQVTARVPGQAISKNVRYFEPVSPRNLAIYGVEPNEGSADGGQQVTIRGRGFAPPLDVVFTAGGTDRTAVVASVNSAGTELVVITPKAPIPVTSSLNTDIRVTAGVGTTSEVTETILRAYIYTAPTPPGAPAIYQIVPSQGLDRGGDQVTIYGANFYAPVTVKFGDEDVQSVSISADRASLLVLSPKHSRGGTVGPEKVGVTIRAAGGEVTRTNGWTWLPPTTEPQAPVIYSASPNKGSPRGGGEVTLRGANLCWEYNTITGKCAAAPQVSFGPAAFAEKSASVLSYSEDGSQVVVITPMISPNPVLTDVNSEIIVRNARDTATLRDGFTFLSEAGDPQIFSVSPNKGSARGGDTVVIYGKYFIEPVQVDFSGAGLAQFISVSADKTEITVKTPPASVAPIEEDRFANVKVVTQFGTGREREFTLANAYLYIADEPTPELFALSPNSGPVDGGTRVTITGQGFQSPVQVFFGDRQAQVVTSNFFQVVCLAPSITPSQPGTPTNVEVTVLNITTGKRSNGLTFRYGEAMFLSAISPNRGPADAETTVTIYGQGFVGPVEVVTSIGGQEIQANVMSVSGTEIIAKIQPLPADRRSCGVVQAGVEVTNINSNISASGISFYYESPTPLITSVEVVSLTETAIDNRVTQYDPRSAPVGCASAPEYAWNRNTVTVRGSNFQQMGSVSAMVASIPGVVADIPTTWVGPNAVTFTLPDLTGVVMQEISCINTTSQACGLQYVDTPVAVTLKNLRSGCEDTLEGAIIIEPCNKLCREAVLRLQSPMTISGSLVQGQPFTLSIPFTPTPAPIGVNATVTLSFIGFTATPGSTTIAQTVHSPWAVDVTPTSQGSGTIVAQIGTGTCSSVAQVAVGTIRPPLPTVTGVNPNTGPASGGTSVTITGTNLTGATAVTFGGTAATGISVVNATTLTCSTPAHAAGPVAVQVTTPSGPSNPLPNAFTYQGTSVAAVNPNTGPAAGGTAVTITGTNFTGTISSVTFGGTAATAVVRVDDSTITCTTPAHAAGAVAVSVTSTSGTGSLPNGYTFTSP